MIAEAGKRIWNGIESLALWLFSLLYKMLRKEPTKEAKEAYLQFVRFGLVGVSNTAVSYILYAVSLVLMRSAGILAGYDYLAATGVSFALSVLWSFFWNYNYVFTVEEGEKRAVFPALVKTYISYSFTGLFLNGALMVFWVQALHISEFLGPVLNLLLSVPINFAINKFWAFQKQ